MCSYINSNKIKYILCFMLIFIFLFHFSFKCYALGTLVFSLGIKVLIVILASMGILAWVQNGMGVEQFYEDFCNWCEQKKGEMEIRNILFNMVYQNLKTGAKMKVRKISGLIKEFLKTLTGNSRLSPTITNPIFFENHTYSYQKYYVDAPLLRDVYDNYSGDYQRYIDKYYIGNGYSLVFTLRRNGDGYNCVEFYWEYNGQLVLSDSICSSYYGQKTSNYMHDLYIEFIIESDGDVINLIYDIYSYVDNFSRVESVSVPFPELVGLREGLGEMDRPDTLPVPLEVPYELAFPIDGILDALDYVGKTYEELMEAIAAVSTTTYVDYVVDMPVSIVNTYEMPSICVDEGDVIVEVDIPDIPDYAPGIAEQTGILAKILAFLEGLFVIPDDLEIDTSPLQNIKPSEKFPFSLPWDLKRSVETLKAPGEGPKWEWQKDGAILKIDFEEFETLSIISRSFLSIIFVIMLIILTRRFIGGA